MNNAPKQSRCHVLKNAPPCDECGETKWPQVRTLDGGNVCFDCLDKAEFVALTPCATDENRLRRALRDLYDATWYRNKHAAHCGCDQCEALATAKQVLAS